MKSLACILALLFAATPAAAGPAPEVVALAKSLEGKSIWLRVGVVRLQWQMGGGTDAANVYRDGTVKYEARFGGMRKTEATSFDQFLADAERVIHQGGKSMTVKAMNSGTGVTITTAKAEDDQMVIEFHDAAKSKQKVTFKFGNGAYGVEDVNRLLKVCFADSEAEAKGTATVTIKMGMTVEEVIAAKGAPKTKVELGSKTILTYPDMKLVFENGKLVDVQ
jgi:hypothetical protein